MDETKRMFIKKLDEFMYELAPLINIAPKGNTRDKMIKIQATFEKTKKELLEI